MVAAKRARTSSGAAKRQPSPAAPVGVAATSAEAEEEAELFEAPSAPKCLMIHGSPCVDICFFVGRS